MNNKKIFGINLFIISMINIIKSFSLFLEIELPDILTIIMGCITIIISPILIYSSIKMLKMNKKIKEQ